MVEDGGLGGAGCRAVVVRRDGVQQFGSHRGIEITAPLLDQPEPQVDMSEQASFVRLSEHRPAFQLARPADVVQQGRSEEQVGAEPRVELRRLPAQGRHADGVFQQAARIAVVAVGAGGRERSQRGAKPVVAEKGTDDAGEAGVRDLGGEELEKAVQLVGVPAQRRDECCGIRVGRRFQRAHLHLETPAEALDAAQDAHGVALREASVEELDVIPDAGVDLAARVDELEREVRGAAPRSFLVLAGHRVHALDGPVLDQFRDGGHGLRV